MDEQVVVLLASIGENSEDGFRRSVLEYKGVLNLRIFQCFVVQSYSLKQFLLWASKDDVDYLPMAKPNALIHSEIRYQCLVCP